jgi:hypothetical protein
LGSALNEGKKMKYCPNCETEYLDTIEECADCKTRLIGEEALKTLLADREREAREVFVKIATVENKFEADVLTNTLKKECIPVMVRSFHDTAYDGIYIPQKGWGIILVPAEDKDKAEEIITAVKNTIIEDTEQSE